MPTINVSELIQDPDFAQTFTVKRQTGSWVNGRFVGQTKQFKLTGTIIPKNTRDMNQIPEGDQIKGTVEVYTLEMLFTTILAQNQWQKDRTSDVIIWNGEDYKILQSQNYLDFGYSWSTADRMFGA